MSSVASHGRPYLLLLLFALALLFHLGARAANAADTIDGSRNITDGETLVSAGGNFTMGFFSLGVPARRYLGIWFSFSEDAVCWVANRDRPINGTSGVLALGDTGRLLLLHGGRGKGLVAWSSNATDASAESAVVQLLDSGNLVVRDKASNVLLWQSFDYPADTLLPGMKTGKNLWTGAEWYITSWSSPTDPSPGPYRRGMETKGLPEIALWRDGIKKYRSGPFNGVFFNGVPEMVSYANMFTYQGQLPKDHPLLQGLHGRLKELSPPLPNRIMSNYTREVEIVCDLQHENLVRLLAYCNDGDERILVYEHVHNKSLDLFIFANKATTRASLNWAKRLEIVKGICQGVWYLHEGSGENIVHRDLKPSNVLLDRQFVPKIADFGTLKTFREDQTGTQM